MLFVGDYTFKMMKFKVEDFGKNVNSKEEIKLHINEAEKLKLDITMFHELNHYRHYKQKRNTLCL